MERKGGLTRYVGPFQSFQYGLVFKDFLLFPASAPPFSAFVSFLSVRLFYKHDQSWYNKRKCFLKRPLDETCFSWWKLEKPFM